MASPRPIPLAPGALLIGDLHLDAADAASCAAFASWLGTLAATPQILILGDLFDAWVGPAHARLEGAELALEALARAARGGVQIDLVVGNRDFLLGADFERRTGARVHAQGVVCGLPGTPQRLLAIHGDELCTRDRSYQRLKRLVRSPPARWLAPRLPDSLALSIARRMRRASQQAVAVKPSEQKEQQRDAVLSLAREQGTQTVVCGHAHRFRDELLPGGVRWVVVDAFGGPKSVVRVQQDGLLEVLSPAEVRSGGAARGP
jgi:UDP-2,3-diacylglucosamine hydrolase